MDVLCGSGLRDAVPLSVPEAVEICVSCRTPDEPTRATQLDGQFALLHVGALTALERYRVCEASPRATASRMSLAKPLPRDRSLNVSTFAYLFAELLSYHRERVTSLADLETRLAAAGHGIGVRFLDLVATRDRPGKRDVTTVTALQFVCDACWRSLFGRKADGLEKAPEAGSFYIRDADPLPAAFMSMPKELARFNPACFVAGIVRGLLEAAGFPTTRVAALTEPAEGGGPRDKTVYLITFDPSVLAREAS